MGLFNRNKFTKVNSVSAQPQNPVMGDNTYVQVYPKSIPNPPSNSITPQDKLPPVKDLSKAAKDMLPQIIEQMMKQQPPQNIVEPEPEVLDQRTEVIEQHPNHKLFKAVQELKADIKAKQEALKILESLY